MSALPKSVHVAVAVITAADGKILLTRRASDKHQGGLWEFPGGKCEPGEPVRAALAREIREELDIEITTVEPLISIPYQYPDLHVLLEVFRVTSFTGKPRGAEGQPMQWVTPGQLDEIPLPAANRPIVRAIQLPQQYLVTPDLSDSRQLYQGVMAAAAGGSRLIQLRTPQLERTDYLKLADRLLADLPDTAMLLLKGELPDLLTRPQAGWHLTSAQLRAFAGQERPLPANRWLAASCHDAEELALAQALGCDFATLSPVQPTASHPDAPALGLDLATELTAAAQLPVFWLGGMQTSDLKKVRAGGGQGIAAIRGLWGPEPLL